MLVFPPDCTFQSTPSVWRETHVTVTVSSPSAQFQSTPSVWRETLILRILTGTRNNFNPLPPYGGRQQKQNYRQDVSAFQSTPSVWRETCKLCQYLCASSDFNPLPPYGGRPMAAESWEKCELISIHSLRMEGDLFRIFLRILQKPFQSTPSVWRETLQFRQRVLCRIISIHSLRMEGDVRWVAAPG